MARGGRDNLSDPIARALPYACLAIIASVVAATAIAGRFAMTPSILALLAAAVLYGWRWGRVREARFEALRDLLERDPVAARAALDALISAQRGARLFDPFVWRLAWLDAWREGALDRYASLADAALASVGPRAAPALVLRAHAAVGFARALTGDGIASRAALDRCASNPSTDEDRSDARAMATVAYALLHLREGHVEQARETVVPVLSSLATAAPEVREVALAILGAQPAEAVAAEGYRGAIDERASARDRALSLAFPAVKFARIEATAPDERPLPSLEIDPASRRATLPAPIRSRVDPIARASAPATLGVLAMIVGPFIAPWIALVGFAMGALVLLAIALDRGRAARDRASTERTLRELRAQIAGGGAASAHVRGVLEGIAATSTAALASEACALRSRVARAEGDLAGALAWSQQCLARLHSETQLRGAVAELRAEAVETAMLSLAALGDRAQAERYALLFEKPSVVEAQLAAVRLVHAARDGRAVDATADVRGYAQLAAQRCNVPEVLLLAQLVLSAGDPAREEACRVLLRSWPQGRAWVEAVAPSWASTVIAPRRVSVDIAREAAASEHGQGEPNGESQGERRSGDGRGA